MKVYLFTMNQDDIPLLLSFQPVIVFVSLSRKPNKSSRRWHTEKLGQCRLSRLSEQAVPDADLAWQCRRRPDF